MEKQEALKLRKKIKARKPNFIRQDAHKKSKLAKKWKRPRGWQSKVRLHKKGYRREVSAGFGSPKSVAGLHSSGLEMVNVHTLADLENINGENQGIILSSTLGAKKKIEIIKKAQEKNIKILNIDAEKFVKNIEAKMSDKKAKDQAKEAEKEKKKKEAEKKAEEKSKEEKLEEAVTEEEKKDKEKKEKDKVLTTKE